MGKKFEMGKLYATRGVSDLMEEETGFMIFVAKSLEKYAIGDWGGLSEEDKNENEIALLIGERLMGVYEFSDKPEWKIWIIAEWDRSSTTVPCGRYALIFSYQLFVWRSFWMRWLICFSHQKHSL